jgi:hypothetical protein
VKLLTPQERAALRNVMPFMSRRTQHLAGKASRRRPCFGAASLPPSDISLARDQHLSERFTLRLRAESFYLFNHPNYEANVNNVQYTTTQQNDGDGNPTNVWVAAKNPSFGTPLASMPRSGSRSFQFSTRLSF